MNRTERILSLALIVVGLAASTSSAYVHYRLLADPTYASFCDVSSTVSCSQAYTSTYGAFHGVPVALFGIIYFVGMLLLLAWAQFGSTEVRESTPGYMFVSATVGLAVVFYLAYASFWVLREICLLCITTWTAVIGLFILSGFATRFPMTTLPRRAARDLRAWSRSPLAMALTLLFLIGAGSAVTFFPHVGVAGATGMAAAAPAPTQAQLSEIERFMATSPRTPIVLPRDGAKVLIVKFNDFECPPCGQSYELYKPIFAKYDKQQPGAVKLVVKDFPLSSECNPYVAGTGPHPGSCEAAVAVRLAAEHNRTVEMEEWIYANQATLTPQIVRQAAKDVGHVPDFDARYPAMVMLVKGDIEYGHQLGIRSTPTFFVNGVKIEGAYTPQYFDQAIAYELRHPPQ
jgi:uncharacterized membrane protein/protein-disulfide isomerase